MDVVVLQPAFEGFVLQIQAEGTGHHPPDECQGLPGQRFPEGGKFVHGKENQQDFSPSYPIAEPRRESQERLS